MQVSPRLDRFQASWTCISGCYSNAAIHITSQSLSEVLVIVWMRASHFSSYTEACFVLFMFFLLKSLLLLFCFVVVVFFFFPSRHVGS